MKTLLFYSPKNKMITGVTFVDKKVTHFSSANKTSTHGKGIEISRKQGIELIEQFKFTS